MHLQSKATITVYNGRYELGANVTDFVNWRLFLDVCKDFFNSLHGLQAAGLPTVKMLFLDMEQKTIEVFYTNGLFSIETMEEMALPNLQAVCLKMLMEIATTITQEQEKK